MTLLAGNGTLATSVGKGIAAVIVYFACPHRKSARETRAFRGVGSVPAWNKSSKPPFSHHV
jgi:hypothetical protein